MRLTWGKKKKRSKKKGWSDKCFPVGRSGGSGGDSKISKETTCRGRKINARGVGVKMGGGAGSVSLSGGGGSGSKGRIFWRLKSDAFHF